jgi:hypothetical protein
MQHVHLVTEVPVLNRHKISAPPPWWSVLSTATNLNHRIHVVEEEIFLKKRKKIHLILVVKPFLARRRLSRKQPGRYG